MGNKTVLADAQFGIMRTLRPFANFESTYEGVTAVQMINFTEGGVALDPSAGQIGYAANLLRGMPVPYGARVSIWIPGITAFTGGNPATAYNWRLVWRMRSTYDYRNRRVPYNNPKQNKGQTDNSVAPVAIQVPIPAASHSVGYLEAEPAGTTTEAVINVRDLDISPRYDNAQLNPLTPTGATGYIQQGITDPATLAQSNKQIFNQYDTRATGNELMIMAWRPTGTYATWGFNAGEADSTFSQLFGTNGVGGTVTYPDMGVYVLIGAAP